LPGWLSVLTHLDPVAYAVDAIRRVVLASAGLPADQLGALAIAGPGGAPLPIFAEVAILVGFIAIGLALAVRWFAATE
jgi:hypothetical protein